MSEQRIKALECAIEHRKIYHDSAPILDVAEMFYHFISNSDLSVWKNKQQEILTSIKEQRSLSQKRKMDAHSMRSDGIELVHLGDYCNEPIL